MFHRLARQPARPSYNNPKAVEGVRSGGDEALRPWSFGMEVSLYNSRNIYTSGGEWGWKHPGNVDWVAEPGDEFAEFIGDMVVKASNPRVCWGGWTRSWRVRDGVILAKKLFVHKDDVFPKPQSRKGGCTYRTRSVQSAWAAWMKNGGIGVRWCGDDLLEVEYASALNDEDILLLGWKRAEGVGFLDIETPLPQWVLNSGVVLPGHDPQSWLGVSKVVVKTSGAEGCLPASLTVDSPSEAGKILRGGDNLPANCELRVDDRQSFGLFSGGCAPWVEGRVGVSARRMVPLIRGTKHVALHITRNGGAVYRINPDDIDFSRMKRPVLATFFSKSGEEKCVITPDSRLMRTAGAISRSKIVVDSSIFYRVVAPLPNGKRVSTQKMAGGAKSSRLPAQNRAEQQRLESLYGNVVGGDYYQRDESYYRDAAQQRDSAMAEGFLEHSLARERSAVPPDIFDRLSACNGGGPTRIVAGKKYFKIISFSDISNNPSIIREITRIAKADGLGWLCQIVSMHPSEFTKSLIDDALNPE